MIRNIIFDFDGVLCESVHIKTEAFYEMYLSYGKEIASKVKEYHIANGGMSRFDKFRYYEKEFLGKVLTEEKMEILSLKFSTLVKQKVIAAPFVSGALEFLEKHSNNYNCFIVSATPINEMKEIATKKKIHTYFQEIFGSPQNKNEWGKYILETYNMQANETLFIGDALSDYNAATKNKMHFLLRITDDNKNLFSDDVAMIKDLSSLEKYITLDIKL